MTREARRQPHQQLGDFIEHMGGGPGCTLAFDGVSTRPLDALAGDIAVALAPAMRNLWAVGAETMVQPMRPIGELPMTGTALKGQHGGASNRALGLAEGAAAGQPGVDLRAKKRGRTFLSLCQLRLCLALSRSLALSLSRSLSHAHTHTHDSLPHTQRSSRLSLVALADQATMEVLEQELRITREQVLRMLRGSRCSRRRRHPPLPTPRRPGFRCGS